MLVVLSYFSGDRHQAERLANWIADLADSRLGYNKGHDLLLLEDQSIESSLKDCFSPSFGTVMQLKFVNQFDGEPWPVPQNHCWKTAARHIEANYPQPWLWLEPDCVPMSAGWLDALAAEYKSAGKLFMGDYVTEGSPDHMSGIGIYPGEITQHAGSTLMAHDIAWDLEGAGNIVPKAHWTEQIHHIWKPAPFKSIEDVRLMLDPRVVLFHSDKTGSLIQLLRQKLSTGSHVTRGEPAKGSLPRLPIETAPVEPLSQTGQPARSPTGDAVASSAKPFSVWDNKAESLAWIRCLAESLKEFFDCPSHVHTVRQELKKAGVIK